jgi:hypothetical protein
MSAERSGKEIGSDNVTEHVEHVDTDGDGDEFHDSFAVLDPKDNDATSTMKAELSALAKEEEVLALQVEVARKAEHVQKLKSDLNNLTRQNTATGGQKNLDLPQPCGTRQHDPPPPLTTKTLPKNPVMEDFLLESMDMLSSDKAVGYQYQEENKGTCNDVTTTTSNGVKYLKIKDFVRVVGHIDNEDEVELCGADGRGLFLKTSQNNRVRNITVAQWISANLRIMKALKARGELRDQGDDYNKYTSDVGDLLQVYPTHKVIAYDDYYRQRRAEGEIKHWGDPCQQGVTVCLQSNANQSFGLNSYSNNRKAYSGQSG